MKKKSVWLINQYLCTPELNGDGHRHSFLAEEWKNKGYDVTLITSSFSHVPFRENKFKGIFKIDNSNIRTLLIKGNKYSETQGFKRVLSWLVFCFFLFFIPTKKIPKPDIIIVSSNSLLPILNVIFYFKKRFKKVRFILEIRDIWPLTLIEIGGFSKKNIFIKVLSWVERLGYQKADYLVSLLEFTDKHINTVLKHNNFNYKWISNGYQLQKAGYYNNIPEATLLKIPKDKFIVGYAGSLGKANAMEFLIDGFKKLDKNVYSLCLLGIGDEMHSLKKRAEGYDNIVFLGKVKKAQVQSFLQECDLLYLGIRDLPLYRFGISMNKTFDYMFSEKPILLSTSAPKNIVEKANCGMVVLPQDINTLVEKIKEFKNMNFIESIEMGKRGKVSLLKHFTYEKLADDYILIFESLYV
ncbi:glycosyltransferase family 4 protein [Psychroserpens sp. NJDZ02]|uniref:glycosyltransferase family 4 protein n=1 Tax=Psychroserpens sp. NJDZ02 TaxID=2570561 RepID=UPI0010A7E534|nr:glycosyltransferase family 4 protein [Psychroserpens sp. NJDZ02]QCE41146.1 glycosyltransferase family 4 protein [Psychroserpens sp. NJDZ02]